MRKLLNAFGVARVATKIYPRGDRNALVMLSSVAEI